MGLHNRDLSLLLQLQQNLGGIGSIHINSTLNKVNLSVDSKKDLTILIHHLENYPLLTQKGADFILFKEAVKLMIIKDHLSIEGLKKIINIKASMNLGLSDFLKSEFNEINPVERPEIQTDNIPDSNWVAGFATGEGNFDVRITRQSTNNIGYRVQLRFRISQHDRDTKLMEHVMKYLGTGKIYKYSSKSAIVLTIFNFSDITNLILPFFEQNPILGMKFCDYLDWCKIAKFMKEGKHLTLEGLNKIRLIQSGMNTGRKMN
jgi:LAGLIDADG endonuclease